MDFASTPDMLSVPSLPTHDDQHTWVADTITKLNAYLVNILPHLQVVLDARNAAYDFLARATKLPSLSSQWTVGPSEPEAFEGNADELSRRIDMARMEILMHEGKRRPEVASSCATSVTGELFDGGPADNASDTGDSVAGE